MCVKRVACWVCGGGSSSSRTPIFCLSTTVCWRPVAVAEPKLFWILLRPCKGRRRKTLRSGRRMPDTTSLDGRAERVRQRDLATTFLRSLLPLLPQDVVLFFPPKLPSSPSVLLQLLVTGFSFVLFCQKLFPTWYQGKSRLSLKVYIVVTRVLIVQ